MGTWGSKPHEKTPILDQVFVSYDISLTNQDMIIIQGENKIKVDEMATEIRELNKNSPFKECDAIYDDKNKRWRQEFYFHRNKSKVPTMVKISHFSEY